MKKLFCTKETQCGYCGGKLQPHDTDLEPDEVTGLYCPWCEHDENQGVAMSSYSPDEDKNVSCTHIRYF